MLTVYKVCYIISFVAGKVPSNDECRSGGTGRRTGLKILRDLPLVPVRFRSSAPYLISRGGAVGSSSGS